jgi:hypothetical protein
MTTSFRSDRATPASPGTRPPAEPTPGQASPLTPPGFLAVPRGLIGDLTAVPFDLYLLAGLHAVLYARRGTGSGGSLGRGGGFSEPTILVRAEDGPALRASLLGALAEVVAIDPDRTGRDIARADRIARLGAAALEPVLGPLPHAVRGTDRRPTPIQRDLVAVAAALEAAGSIGTAVAAEPWLAGRMLFRQAPRGDVRRPAPTAISRVAIDRALDAIALAAVLAHALGVEPSEAAQAAALRDMTLDHVAARPSGLANQWQHAIASADLALAAGAPLGVGIAIAAHHERLDGSGHPAGLTARELGPTDRLVALVDILVTMTRRDGGGGLPIGEAFRALRMAVSGRFDGRTVFALAGLIGDGTLSAGRSDRA